MNTFKRISLLLLAVSIIGVSTVYANTTYSRYVAKKITVKVNNNSDYPAGLSVDLDRDDEKQKDIPMLRADALLSAVGGFAQYNSKDNTIDIYKPNVQLLVYAKDNKDPFGRVTRGDKIAVSVFAQVDSLLTDIQGIKYVVRDPGGAEVASEEIEVKRSQENFFSNVDLKTIHFKLSGKYTVNMYMKPADSDQYALVAQLGIYSES